MTKTERELVDAAMAAKSETIIVLSDVIDHLRAQLHAAAMLQTAPETGEIAALPTPMFEVADAARMHMSDEEEDIEFMRASGTLSDEQADAALQIVGARGPIQLVK
jgi:DNA-directed RNA polymerase specialized sigma24 family protein